MRRFRNLIRTAGLLLTVAREYRSFTKEVGILKLRRTLGLLKRSIGPIRRVARASQYLTQVPDDSRDSKVCFVLGNGPSLKADLSGGLGIFGMGDTFCVNDFVKSDLYEAIRPKYYVIADPWNWLPPKSERSALIRSEFFDLILNKTTWPLTLFVPFEARSFLESIFSGSLHVHLSFYNTTSMDGEKIVANLFYDLGMAMPPCQNVLIGALYLSLRLGYKKIILLGADHSWHETLALDDANRVCMRPLYFNAQDAALKPWFKDFVSGEVWTMGELFHALGTMFEGYWKIEEYAEHLGAQVYNASSVTYIDAFKRKSVSDIRVELADGEQIKLSTCKHE